MKRHIITPLLLAVYLGFISYLGFDGVKSGDLSMGVYVATILVTLAVIVALYFVLKRRGRLRREREEDIRKNQNNK